MVSPPSPRDRRKWTKAMMDKEEEQHADRVDAILELKANTDKVRSRAAWICRSSQG